MGITDKQLESIIVKEDYKKVSDRMTICILTTKSGFEVLGKSSCLKVEDFSQELGERYSREDAINQLWELEGYRIKGGGSYE